MNSSSTTQSEHSSSDAAFVVEALIRTLFNEKPETLMVKTYGRERHRNDPYMDDKLDVAYNQVGGWVRWLGSLDDDSIKRLTQHVIERELRQLEFFDGKKSDYVTAIVEPKRAALRSFL